MPGILHQTKETTMDMLALKIDGIASLLQVSENCIRDLVKDNWIPHTMLAGSPRFSYARVKEWFDSGCPQPRASLSPSARNRANFRKTVAKSEAASRDD